MFASDHLFVGVVEDVNDPLKTGRVRVRIYSVHDESKTLVPTTSLPWARCLLPNYSASSSGVGTGPHCLVTGSYVIGIFEDTGKQKPIVLGTYHGTPLEEAEISKGFNDPSGEYPRWTEESDINRLARNEFTELTILQDKDDNRVKNINIAGGGTWNEPPSSYGAIYPNNLVTETPSGHVIELDDTPGKERMHWYHRTGTYMEWFPDGKMVIRSQSHQYDIVNGSIYEYIKEDNHHTVDGGEFNNILDAQRTDVKNNIVTNSADGNINFSAVNGEMTYDTPVARFSHELHTDLLFANTISFEDLRVANLIEGVAEGAITATRLGPVNIPGGDSGASTTITTDQLLLNLEHASNAATGKTNLFIQDTAPTVGESILGDVYLDSSGDTETVQRFDGLNWGADPDTTMKVKVTDLTDVGGAGKKTEAYIGSGIPDTEIDQAIHIDTITGSIKKFVESNSQWIAVSGIAMSLIANDTNNVDGVAANTVRIQSATAYLNSIQALDSMSRTTAALDGTVATYYQDGEPGAPDDGDFWIETDNDNALWEYDLGATTWATPDDEDQIRGVLLANQEVIEGKSTTFFAVSGSPPTAEAAGDIWFQTDTKLQYRWNGASWDLIENSGDGIDGGTITATSFATTSTGERVEIDSASGGEIGYYGDRGDTTIEQLYSVKLTGTVISTLGSVDTTHTCLKLINDGTNPALEVVTGDIKCVDVDSTGNIGCVDVNASGDIGCVNMTSTGTVQGDDVKATGFFNLPNYATEAAADTASPVNQDICLIAGLPCYFNGTDWKYFSDNTTVT
ncbi:MAG: hypothetical protein KAS32_23555 [Candidatus Peribacteraceae bacterium]|nr:hypothetical protein [Candidatus Peribacteraceae bacterium]